MHMKASDAHAHPASEPFSKLTPLQPAVCFMNVSDHHVIGGEDEWSTSVDVTRLHTLSLHKCRVSARWL